MKKILSILDGITARREPAVFVVAAMLLYPALSFANSFSIYEENDFLEKDKSGSTTDGWRTQALRFQFNHTNNWGTYIEQDIFTPENKDSKEPQYGDRPYAGYLHLAYFQNFLKGQQDDYFKIDAGIIGPYSFAEETQDGFHKLFGMARPQGWYNQLKTEPALNGAYYKSYSHRFCPWFEYKPFAGANFGNVLIDAELGNFVRAGWNLPRTFNPTMYSFSSENRREKEYEFYFYLFAGIIGQAVAYDHFLDGSLFQSEDVSVSHKTFTANGSIGACAGFYGFEITFTHIEQTEQWLTQPQRDNKWECLQASYKF